MKITDIKSFLLTAPRDLHIVKIETDSGLYGWGEAGCSTREYGQEGVLRHFREFLVGMDPMRIEHIWQILYRSAYYEGGRIQAAVISAAANCKKLAILSVFLNITVSLIFQKV